MTRAKSTSHFKHHVMKEIQMYAFQFLKIRNHHTICILNLELTENIDGNWSSIRPPNTVSGATLQSIVAPQWNSINT